MYLNEHNDVLDDMTLPRHEQLQFLSSDTLRPALEEDLLQEVSLELAEHVKYAMDFEAPAQVAQQMESASEQFIAA